MYRFDITLYRGAQIRVNRGMYYHHGIYIGDNTVIHFASNTPGYETDPNFAEVCETTLEGFLKGGALEVREYSNEELKDKRDNQAIIDYAKSAIGRKGYNLITNNCEHFSNECAFGKAYSSQVDSIRDLISSLFR